MNILLLGAGGREHALAWKLAQSRLLAHTGDRLYAAPGNPGIAEHADCVSLDAADHAAVIGFCEANRIGLVVIGPEAPLVDGLADSLHGAGIRVFGPSRAAAQLEGSKAFTKEICERAGIPTAVYRRAGALDEAIEALGCFAPPYVLKADGLAAGKGVVIAETRADAEAALAAMFRGGQADVLIEEFMHGEEVSFFAITDGITVLPFGSAQDHKRVGEGDTGPNTGGMGAYSPASVLTPLLRGEVIERIIAPTVRAMADAGTPYSGVLFAGLMLTASGPRLIEYNCRFGDPECQVLMMRLEDDLGELLLACAENRLSRVPPVRMAPEVALTVVVAAEGYPDTPVRGGAIDLGAARSDAVKIFHAGTARDDTALDDTAKAGGRLVANGGRVLAVSALGATASDAAAKAYAAVDSIDFPDGFCRRDIGYREIARERAAGGGA